MSKVRRIACTLLVHLFNISCASHPAEPCERMQAKSISLALLPSMLHMKIGKLGWGAAGPRANRSKGNREGALLCENFRRLCRNLT